MTPRRGPGRPPGMPNQRTTAIGATLDAAHAKVSRALLDEVIPDRQLAQLLWKLALEGDGRVATYLADRKWGRVKFELDHEEPTLLKLLIDCPIPYVARAMSVQAREDRLLPASTARDEPLDPDQEPSKH